MIPEFDRVEIIDFINAKGYLNYLRSTGSDQ